MRPARTGRSRRRRLWWSLVLLAFVAMPLVELYVIIQVGQVIGAWWTILLLIADGVLGTWLIRHEGRRAWAAPRAALAEGRLPATELSDGILILVGGTLMLAPGFVSDAIGLVCVLPVTRPLGRRLLAGVVARRLLGATWRGGPGHPGAYGTGAASGEDRVVRGDVVD